MPAIHRWTTLLLLIGVPAMSHAEFAPQLLRLDLDTTKVAPGQPIRVVYWWHNASDAIADEPLNVFVHARLQGAPEDNKAYVMFGGDYAPAPGTMQWYAGRTMRMCRRIGVPPDAKPGVYDILVGLYSLGSGERIPLQNADLRTADGRYRVAQFEVVQPGAAVTPSPKSFTLASAPPGPAFAPAALSAKTLTAERGKLRIVCDATKPVLYRYEMAGHTMAAELEPTEPQALVCSTSDARLHASGQPSVVSTYDAPTQVSAQATTIAYPAHVRIQDAPAVDYTLTFELADGSVTVGLGNVVEHSGYQLMSVTLPRLASAPASEGGSMVLPTNSGRLVSAATALPDAQEHPANWFTIRACAGITVPGLVVALDVPSQDDVLLSSVSDLGADKTVASLSARLTYRVRATKPALQFVAHKQTSVRLEFATVADGMPNAWTEVAKLLRARLGFRPPAVYRGAVIYKIFCDSPGAQSFTTFDQAFDLVRKLKNLTDGMPQIAYLVGWQHHGHDTGYPDVFTVNERLGGYDKLCQVMREAEKYNAVLSFHDNYDDAYRDSPAWRDDIIARDDRGKLMAGGVWAGGQSYIISYAAYLQRGGLERVRRTLSMFPIRKSYHIDVMSACPERRDWNPEHPVSADEMLAARKEIVHEFNKAGVDVTSEGFTGPLLGTIGHAWHMFRKHEGLYENDVAVPFIPFIYHGHATAGGGLNPDSPADVCDALLYGVTFSNDYTKDTPLSHILDQVYLVNAPFQALREREMRRYEVSGSVRTVWYDDNTYVRVDATASPHGRYEVVVDGDTIARDYNTLVPCPSGDGYLCYSKWDGEVRFPLPKALRLARGLTATRLTPEGTGDRVPCRIEEGAIVLDAPPQQPVKITP